MGPRSHPEHSCTAGRLPVASGHFLLPTRDSTSLVFPGFREPPPTIGSVKRQEDRAILAPSEPPRETGT